MDTRVMDRGFCYDWLIVNVIRERERVWSPANLQVCHPTRPTSVLSGGPGRRRFEFMLLPHENREEMNHAGSAWSLIRPWGLSPENAHLECHAVYT
ncbi:hypothetical protein ACGF5O_46730 [Streptomyces sp. NPDC048291]|uniref:hypothetical protein n=1 Tax=Streptomyces sp. NPDC048291 TaxID=3365530 RepID=UPI00371BB1C3